MTDHKGSLRLEELRVVQSFITHGPVGTRSTRALNFRMAMGIIE